MIVARALLDRADSATRAVLRTVTLVGDLDVSACFVLRTWRCFEPCFNDECHGMNMCRT